MNDRPKKPKSIALAFDALVELVFHLRGENGCPWDKKQTLRSMIQYIQEELAELIEAVEKDDLGNMAEEWGDTFFNFLMFAAIAEDGGVFEIEKALRSIEAKMIRRHPHVFGDSNASAVEEVMAQWNSIKAEEKKNNSASLMDSIPQSYSALKRAHHVQKKAAEVGFDWPDARGILEKIKEEICELQKALEKRNEAETSEELGDLLFSCVNLARFIGQDSEAVLSATIDKFIERFKYVEKELEQAGKSAAEASLQEMDELWEKAKKRNRSEK
ncbi:MAG: nucleoside triphosphate pyrophosphohydrolase [Candidatus Abyssobacteria bacterium SURF_5]|uniref:Nucleoside triphosphate pyrophosphohydrolase n=1 Tax=Abyssobacteria bacterium (strain SURF_5) TaxID=2093360 RepID=A0A3A4NUP3_ABYX5|nr:MAG: nucleoside triphosphate pyrophosphohydrolase [Candidatus Abyssubacteria bacterium SURF_5]